MALLKIKELRIANNIQQKVLADILNVTPRTIRLWESGKYEPSVEQLITLADIFQISLDDLVNRNSLKFHTGMHGQGRYECIKCSNILEIPDNLAVIPPCPNCGNTTFRSLDYLVGRSDKK